MQEQHEFSMSMDGSLMPCRYCKETHQPPPEVMAHLVEAQEWRKKPLTYDDMDAMAQRHLEALKCVDWLSVEVRHPSFKEALAASRSMRSIKAALSDIPRLVIEVSRLMQETEKKKPAEAGSVLRDYPIG